MNKKRLQTLKKDLQLVIGKDARIKEMKIKFNMNWWAEPAFDSRQRECGTACCAAGLHCILHPKADLYLGSLFGGKHLDLMLHSDPNCPDSSTALQKYFDLSNADVHFLFFPSYYPFEGRDKNDNITPQMVIKRIDKVLNNENH